MAQQMGLPNGSYNGSHTNNGAFPSQRSSTLDAAAISEAVRSTHDPDLALTLGELEAVHSVEIDGNTVKIYLLLYQPLHFVAERINAACTQAVREVAPTAHVEIYVQEKLSAAAGAQNRPLPHVKNLVAIASGKGGVGKSTIAANLAAALARKGATVGLIDADIHGPSVPTLFNVEEHQLHGTKTEDGKFIGQPIEQYGVKLVSMGFVMERDQAAIMRGPMQAGYLNTFIEQIDWGELDYLLFDLPPGTGDIHLTMAQRIPLTGAVVVTTPQNLALADVRRGITMFKRVNVDTLGVIENMSYYALPDGSRDYIFGQGGGERIANEAGVPFLGEIPLNISIRRGGDEGMPVVLNDHAPLQQSAIMTMTGKLAAEVRRKNMRALSTPTVQISL